MTKEQFFIGLAVCMSAISLLAGVQNNSPLTDTSALKIEVDTLKNKLEAQQQAFTNLQSGYYKLAGQFYYTQSKFSSGTFSSTSTGFQLIGTSYGNLLVSLKNVEKFGDGYRLTFSFGNPTSIGISGLKGKITWQPATDYPKYYSDTNYKQEIDQKTHTKDFQVLSELYPGAWNTVSVTIGPANEENIGEIGVGNLEAATVLARSINLPN